MSSKFAASTPKSSVSKSIFNVFSPSTSDTKGSGSPLESALSSSPSSSSSSSSSSSVSSWFNDEVKKSKELIESATESSSSAESTSFWGYLVRAILIVLLLGFAGFNIFKEMGIITDDVLEFIRPVTDFGSNIIELVSKQFVSATSEGTRTGIDIVSGAAKSGVNVIEDQVTGKGIDRPGSNPADSVSDIHNLPVPSSGGGTAKQEAARARALTMNTGSQLDAEPIPLPDQASSVTQKGKISGKAGYCLVGEDRGHRGCVYVNESDTCMSGNIFPTKDKCINPSLRV